MLDLKQLEAELKDALKDGPYLTVNVGKDILFRALHVVQQAQQQPVAYMRKWAADGEIPTKARNENGRMAWPKKFKFLRVTVDRIFNDDVPLIKKGSYIE